MRAGHQYRTLFPDMVTNLAEGWGQDDFPFLQVQLAPFMASRTSRAKALGRIARRRRCFAANPDPGRAVVITDVGNPKDIHPVWKKPVANGLALAARGIAYWREHRVSGPQYGA